MGIYLDKRANCSRGFDREKDKYISLSWFIPLVSLLYIMVFYLVYLVRFSFMAK